MVKNLQPEIQKNMHVIAKEEAELERLREQVEQAEAKLAKDHDALRTLSQDVKSGKKEFYYGARLYTVAQVKADLTSRLERVKTTDATLDSLRQILAAREQGLEAGRQKLEAMLNARHQLIAKIENLAARKEMVEVAKASSEFSFDDSKLGQVKELIDDLQTRIQVAEKLVTVEGSFHDQIPLDKPATEDVVEQVAQYLDRCESGIKVAEVSTTKAE
jgi:chromosome segregation ATPase